MYISSIDGASVLYEKLSEYNVLITRKIAMAKLCVCKNENHMVQS